MLQGKIILQMQKTLRLTLHLDTIPARHFHQHFAQYSSLICCFLIYKNLKNIVDNPSDFSEYEISQHLAEAEDNYPYRHGRYSGNYNADLAEKDSLVYKFYVNYKIKQTLYKKTRKNRPNDLGKEIYDLISKVTEIDNES